MSLEDLTEEDKAKLIEAFVAPLKKRQHYTLQGKLLLYSWGKEVDISEEEWKLAEELGWVEPIK